MKEMISIRLITTQQCSLCQPVNFILQRLQQHYQFQLIPIQLDHSLHDDDSHNHKHIHKQNNQLSQQWKHASILHDFKANVPIVLISSTPSSLHSSSSVSSSSTAVRSLNNLTH